jgi:hypothetical protein
MAMEIWLVLLRKINEVHKRKGEESKDLISEDVMTCFVFG